MEQFCTTTEALVNRRGLNLQLHLYTHRDIHITWFSGTAVVHQLQLCVPTSLVHYIGHSPSSGPVRSQCPPILLSVL